MFRNVTTALFALALVLCFAPTSARADKLSKEDKDLIKDAMRDLEMGAQSGRLARTQSNSDGVQHFANLVVGQNAKMIEWLHEFSNKHEFTFDGDPTKPDVRTKKELEESKGQRFDLRYMSMAVHEHEEMLDIWKKGAKEAKNDDLRDWFDKKQGAIKEKLGNARELYEKVKAKDKD